MNSVEKISLTELQLVIRDKLYESFPGYYYVVAEISEIKVNSSGHCYLELTDSEKETNKVTARVRATIWAGKYRIISALFETVTGMSLQPGITILFRATIEYHELYGLSLNITDIDPKYTIGEIASKRETIIHRLSSEGVLDINRTLDMSLYPRRIAVVSSSSAAGYQDFIKQLSSNIHGFAFTTELFDTTMQGAETEKSVITSLERIATKADMFDAVALIRGGGSQTDLAWFDNYNIAYFITQFPLPVITGIGHDKDMTVSDIVSWKALKTPTAVADFFITRTLTAEITLNNYATNLSALVQKKINESSKQLSVLAHLISSSAKSALRYNLSKTDNLRQDLIKVTSSFLRQSEDHVSNLEKELQHLDPMNILKRGFTITACDGKIIKDHKVLKRGDKISTYFQKGIVESSVENIKDKPE